MMITTTLRRSRIRRGQCWAAAARSRPSARLRKGTLLGEGQKIAHRKSTPQKSSWIFSGLFQWMFSSFSNGMSLFSGMFQRIVTCSVDVYWDCPMDFQRHFPMDFNFVDFWCVIFCPDFSKRLCSLLCATAAFVAA